MHELASFLPLVAIALLFWLLVIRPASRRQKARRPAAGRALSVGDEVMLTSGIFGTVRRCSTTASAVEIAAGVRDQGRPRAPSASSSSPADADRRAEPTGSTTPRSSEMAAAQAATRAHPGRLLPRWSRSSYGLVALAGAWKPELGLDLQGGTRITLIAKGDPIQRQPRRGARHHRPARQRLRRRRGRGRPPRATSIVVVEIPGESRRDLVETVKRQAQLRFRLVACRRPAPAAPPADRTAAPTPGDARLAPAPPSPARARRRPTAPATRAPAGATPRTGRRTPGRRQDAPPRDAPSDARDAPTRPPTARPRRARRRHRRPAAGPGRRPADVDATTPTRSADAAVQRVHLPRRPASPVAVADDPDEAAGHLRRAPAPKYLLSKADDRGHRPQPAPARAIPQQQRRAGSSTSTSTAPAPTTFTEISEALRRHPEAVRDRARRPGASRRRR